jgi:hypothetical protein
MKLLAKIHITSSSLNYGVCYGMKYRLPHGIKDKEYKHMYSD